MEYKLGNSLRVKAKGETDMLICPKCKKETSLGVFSNGEMRLAPKITLFDISTVYFLVCPECASVFTVDESKGKAFKQGDKTAIKAEDLTCLEGFKD